jgi:hypothetical protein
MDVAAWLQSLSLARYEPLFRDNEIDWEVLPKLTPEDLKEIGVVAIGHRRKLLAAIAALGAETSSQACRWVPKPPTRSARSDAILVPVAWLTTISASRRAARVRPARPSVPRRLSVPVSLPPSIPVRFLTPTCQCFGQDAPHVAAAQITGALGEPLSLLPGPVLRADPRCSIHEMTESLLNQ